MQPPVTPERGSYTSAQVKQVIQNESAVIISAGCELINANLDLIADFTTDLVGGEVSRSNYANIHGTFKFRVARELPWGQAIVRPYMVITDGTYSPRFNLGAYYTNTPRRRLGTQPLEYDVEAYDLLHALSTPTGEAYAVAAGTRYLDAVKDCLNNLGFTNIRMDALRRSTVLGTNKVWPLDEATTWLTVVNDLLAAIGYRGIYVDWNGYFVCERYETPETRQSEWTYDTDPNYSILSPEREYERDFFNAPNRWVAIRSSNTDGVTPVPGNGVYTYTNQNKGETSVQGRGGRIINRILQFDAVDQTALIAQTMSAVETDLTLKTKITVKTDANPLHWHFDRLTLTDPEAGANLQVIESEWTLPLDGSQMSHVWSTL